MRYGSRALVTLLLAISMCSMLLLSVDASHASTSYVLTPADPNVGEVCSSLGGSWDGTRTCTLDRNLDLGPSDSITLNTGAVFVIPNNVTMINNGTIDNYGAITNEGGIVVNSGTITAFIANGNITNDGSMTNDPGGSITVEHSAQTSVQVGSFNFTNSGIFNNRGTFVNFGNLTNGAEASIFNSGSFSFESATINVGKFSAPVAFNAGNFTNVAGGTVTEDGATINNTGIITNAGTIAEEPNVFSRINNLGTLTINGTMTNNGIVANVGGTIINSGTLNNLAGCSTASCGTITNSGLIINEPGGNINNQGNIGNYNANPRRPQLGTLTNDGTLTNSDVFINTVGGTTTNSGTVINSGTLTNVGSFSNFGSIINSGNILNSGYINNNSTATITNSRTITNSGNITDSGTISDVCGGITYGTGIVTGNPVGTVTVCTATETQVPEFPTDMLALVMLSVLIVVSLAAMKGLWRPA